MATPDNSTTTVNPPYCKFQEDFKYILLPVSYALVFVSGLALNGMALYVIVFRTKTWRPSTVYMFNLTVCDTLYILTLPFLIYYYADENDWPFTEPLCKIIRFLFYANLYGSDHTLSPYTTNMENVTSFAIPFRIRAVIQLPIDSKLVYGFTAPGSILFLCCISLHRFIGVCYPIRSLYWLSARRAKFISAAMWVVVLLCQGPVLYFSRIR